MPITYQHVKSGRLTRVLTPEERASQPGIPDEYRDRTNRRQAQLVRKMDESQKWVRVPDQPLVGLGAQTQPAPIVSEVPPERPGADPGEEPAAADGVKPKPRTGDSAETSAQPTGPKFTRVVTKS